jgi:hypothetical protein
MALKIHKKGVTREMTPEEEAAYNAEQAAQAQREVAEAADQRIPDIKAAACKVITDRYPEWKQRNMIARMVELNTKATPTVDEEAESAALQAVWDWVKSVRAESDRLEADVNLTANDANWPAP